MLSKAVYNLERTQFPVKLILPVKDMLMETRSSMPFMTRTAVANMWLFGGVIKKQLAQSPISKSLIQTSMAATMMEGGIKTNVIPTRAHVTLNIRILPGDDAQSVLSYIRKTIDDDNVKVTPMPGFSNPVHSANINSSSYRDLKKSIQQVYPTALVAPVLNVATSDSRYYTELTDNILRFVPIWVNSEDTQRIHGIDERISVDNYYNCVRFYHQFILNTTKGLY